MAKTNLQGNISLIGFGVLEPSELVVVEGIVLNHVKQLNEKTDYKSLMLKLTQHQKGKSFLHEITAHAQIGNKRVRAKMVERNLYKCLESVLEKIIAGSLHIHRLTKEVGEERIRKEKKQARKEKRI